MFLERGIVFTHEAARAREAGDPRAGGAPAAAWPQRQARRSGSGTPLRLATRCCRWQPSPYLPAPRPPPTRPHRAGGTMDPAIPRTVSDAKLGLPALLPDKDLPYMRSVPPLHMHRAGPTPAIDARSPLHRVRPLPRPRRRRCPRLAAPVPRPSVAAPPCRPRMPTMPRPSGA